MFCIQTGGAGPDSCGLHEHSTPTTLVAPQTWITSKTYRRTFRCMMLRRMSVRRRMVCLLRSKNGRKGMQQNDKNKPETIYNGEGNTQQIKEKRSTLVQKTGIAMSVSSHLTQLAATINRRPPHLPSLQIPSVLTASRHEFVRYGSQGAGGHQQ